MTIRLDISWDESGTKIENELDLIIVQKLNENDKNWSKKDVFALNKPKKFGAFNKNQPCISIILNHCDLSKTNKIMVFVKILTPKIKFIDLEFLKVSVEYDHKQSFIYEKKLTENQNGTLLHIGNMYIDAENEDAFEEVFDYISSEKVLKKQLGV